MTAFIYEKDLSNMKLKILMSPFHTRMVDEISKKYDVSPTRLRKILMENFDMSYLENLPARFNAWKSVKCEEGLDYAVGATLFVDYIPLLSEKDAEIVIEKVKNEIDSGTDRDAAILAAREEIAGMIWR
ncbi:MAG: DUF1959 family protein [Methanomicrobiaceae archaeon]|nr:DUF1959 family protein [Methanomicrobiaceae archaeon]